MKLLIPLDQTKHSEAVLDVVRRTVLPLVEEAYLVAVARLRDVETESVVPPSQRPDTVSFYPGVFPIYWHQEPEEEQEREAPHRIAREDLLRNIEHYLVDAASRLGENVRCTPAVLQSDDPERAILDYARAHRVDMIAMATHGRMGLARTVRGSVTDAVIRSGVAPVLVCRPPEGG